jgi:hypothetical protein
LLFSISDLFPEAINQSSFALSLPSHIINKPNRTQLHTNNIFFGIIIHKNVTIYLQYIMKAKDDGFGEEEFIETFTILK